MNVNEFLSDQARPDRVRRAAVGDVVQLLPSRSKFGPLLCIVDESGEHAVRCYALVPTEAEVAQLYVRVPHGEYLVIGRAVWCMP